MTDGDTAFTRAWNSDFLPSIDGAPLLVQPTSLVHWRPFALKTVSTSSNTSSNFVVVLILLINSNSFGIASLVA